MTVSSRLPSFAWKSGYRFRSYTNPDGEVVEDIFGRGGLVAANMMRYRATWAQ